jgi:nucleotide-binding universal stress UspA family protein
MKITKMKKVLIALDYDPTAQKVAEQGFSLAKTMGAEVILMHVVSDPLHYKALKHFTVMGFAGYDDTVPLILKSVEELKKESQKYLDKSKHHLGDKTIQTIVTEGDLATSILVTAKEVHADIIILGSHSRKWMENTLLGSVAEKVLHNTSIPLFIVPTKKRD